MKTYMTYAVVAISLFAFGIAYADEFHTGNRDVGTALYSGAFPVHETPIMATVEAADRTFAAADDGSIPALNAKNDIGSMLYASVFESGDAVTGNMGVKGSAAGGVAKEDENTRIWDKLLGGDSLLDIPR